jgi:hypothetical protein
MNLIEWVMNLIEGGGFVNGNSYPPIRSKQAQEESRRQREWKKYLAAHSLPENLTAQKDYVARHHEDHQRIMQAWSEANARRDRSQKVRHV